MKLLTKMVDQFKAAHKDRPPETIVIEPLALVALGIKRSVAPVWGGIKVICREIEEAEVKIRGNGVSLGVFMDVRHNRVVSCDI